MPRKKSSGSLKSYRSRVRTKKVKSGGRKLDYLLVLTSVLVIAFVGSFAVKYSIGESSPEVRPPAYLRFQVLNGCGVGGAAAKFASWIRNKSTSEIVIDVIDESNFTTFDEEKTMLLVRDATAAQVERVAELIGFTAEQIVHKELDDNFLDIDFTIVLGKDFSGFLEPEPEQQ
jgi:hypothetical protein